MIPGKSYLKFLDRFVRVGAIVVIAVGAAVLLGWFANIALLKSLLPGLASMKVNTAVAFVAVGASLWLKQTHPPGTAPFRLARFLSISAAGLGGFNLIEDFFGLDLGIDQLILPDSAAAATSQRGRMAPVTALNFLLSGFALVTLKADRPRLVAWANWLAAPPLFLSTLAIVGYAYGVTSLYKLGPFTSIALPTALAFFVLSLSILAADPGRGIGSLFASETAGGVVARRLLPTIPVALFALGWVGLEGQKAGLYDTSFSLALMVLVSIAVSVFSISSTAMALRRVDLTRKRAEASVVELNADLEGRVLERTEELARLSADLTAANATLEQLSLHDSLTSLANRRFFDVYLATQIAVARRHKRPLALVLCDIDCFKAYNDHHRHQAGDDALRLVTAALRSCCRRPADMAARYGGEELVLVLPDTDLAGARLIAETARAAVERLRIHHGHSPAGPYVTVSGGISALVDKIETAEQLIGEADQRLYEAKQSGRNRVASSRELEPARV